MLANRQVYLNPGKPLLKRSYSVLQDDYYRHMVEAGYTDIERGEYNSTEEHLTVTQFKVSQEETRLSMFRQSADLAQTEAEQASKEREKAEQELHEAEQKAQQVKAKVQELASKLKNIEKLAAEFSADPEELLPEASALESAKSYREKKAKPLLARVVKVLRGLYHSYLDLLSKHRKLEKSFDSEQRANRNLADRIEALVDENTALAAKADDYDTLCAELGHNYVREKLQEAKERAAARRIHPVRKPYDDRMAI